MALAITRSSVIEPVLAGLDDATPLVGDVLAPAVWLAPDHLVVGVGAGGTRLVARLGGLPASMAWAASTSGAITAAGELPPRTRELLTRAGDAELQVQGGVGQLCWLGLERDLARIRAGVAALRSLVGEVGVYR
jgi:hypothetical protein